MELGNLACAGATFTAEQTSWPGWFWVKATEDP